ncbi:ATP-binding protein [Phyllobacterium zundukense]|uniref:Winged helix-turn-helix domain-containing protein n=1 Tax=Phyllobacterium zundukense TaxID=1867719 RepID=A0ACD4CY45_9HYPH|nr:winged helix-turn-helix domain-containing protein [Phyllobacterium zundukense]UXN58483.1 winged helix-turn-helix domain-containing protein [Phyllobacterium zundukense]
MPNNRASLRPSTRPSSSGAVAANAAQSGGDEGIYFGPFRLNASERLLVKDNVPVAIGGRALDLLIVLTSRPGQVVSVTELLKLVWPDVFVVEANVRVCVTTLRKALGEGRDGVRYVVNVAGRGYSFVAPIRHVSTNSTPGALNLPAVSRNMVGRNETVDVLSLLLLTRRFVSVVGPGGMGKTTVAVAVANTLCKDFGEDAICFFDVGLLTDPAVIPAALASALGCVVQGPDPEPYIRAFVAQKRMLIVLDNCEHVIEAVASLAERLFHAAPSVHLLATSREALRVAGENVHLLLPLDSPDVETPSSARALASSAVQLFVERASSSGYLAELSDRDAPIVANICRRLDGVPLAIELVASRVGTYGIRGTAELLDIGAELTMQGRRDALSRHQTLRAMVDWSFRLLLPDEQQVLLRLSVFVGQFDLSAAHSVAAFASGETQTVSNTIASLVDKSLIWISSTISPASYRLSDTTRAYAVVKLMEGGEAEVVAKRHARHYANVLEVAAAKSWALSDTEISTYAVQLSNIRKALAWSFSDSGDLSIGVELVAHAAGLLLRISLLEECQQWCRKALGALPDGDRGSLLELALQEALAMSIMYTLGNTEEVRAAIERGLELAESLGAREHQADLFCGLNLFLTRRGDFNGALTAAEQGAEIVKAIGRTDQSAMIAWMLSTAHHWAGDQATALQHCKRGMELMSFLPGRRSFFRYRPAERVSFFRYHHYVRRLGTLARTLWLCGFADQGCQIAFQGIKELQDQRLKESPDFNDPILDSITVLYSIPVLHWSGNIKDAVAHTENAIAHAQKYSLAPYYAAGLALRGELMIVSGDASSGVEILRHALKALAANQSNTVTLATLRALAEGLALLGRHDEALKTINEALTQAQRSSGTLWYPDLLRARGQILLGQHRPDYLAAQKSLLEAMDAARKKSALSWELKAAIPLARMWRDQGKSDVARSMLEGIYWRFTEGFKTQDLVAARKLLDQLGSAN